jgi:protein phosphatase
VREPATWKLEVGFVCDTGRERERNEDACSVFLPYEGEEDRAAIDGLFVVADGMGGHDAGDVASRHVVDRVIATFAPGGEESLTLSVADTIEELIRRIHKELRNMGAERGAERGMGSTLSLAVLEGDVLHVVSIGDSRCYRFRDNRLEQLTRDQSWVAEQVRTGAMSEEEARDHPNRNVLLQCLGIGATPPIELRRESVQAGDRFLLCSDGLHGQVPDEVIARVLAEDSAQAAAQRLVTLANDRGGPDNISAVVVDVQAPRPDLLAITLPGDTPFVEDTATTPVPRRGNRLSIGLLAAGLLLLVGALGAWFWLRPQDSAAANSGRVVAPSDSSRPPLPDSARVAKPPAPADSTPSHPEPRGKAP